MEMNISGGGCQKIFWQGGTEEWQLHPAQDFAKQGESKYIQYFLLTQVFLYSWNYHDSIPEIIMKFMD